MSNFVLTARKRDDQGKGASRRLRRQGMLPAIVYGGHEEPVAITLEQRQVLRNLEEEAFYTQIIELDLDGSKEQVLLKDMQRHPFKPIVFHLDFQRVRDNDRIHQRVPLHIVGEDKAPGVKQYGGLVMHEMTEVEVVCLAKDLPEYIEVDISNLGPNQSLHLSDIPVPEGVQIAELLKGPDHDVAVVTILAKKATAEEEETEGGEAPAEAE